MTLPPLLVSMYDELQYHRPEYLDQIRHFITGSSPREHDDLQKPINKWSQLSKTSRTTVPIFEGLHKGIQKISRG